MNSEEYTSIFDDFDEYVYIFDKDPEINILRMYVALRLNILREQYHDNELTEVGQEFVEQYLNNDISLDLMLNALYNYINHNNRLPTLKMVQDITAFLEDYAEE